MPNKKYVPQYFEILHLGYHISIRWRMSKKRRLYAYLTYHENDLKVTAFKWFILQVCHPENMFKVNNRNTRNSYKICSKLTIKTSEWRQWRRSRVSIVYVEYISYPFLVFLLLNLSGQMFTEQWSHQLN